MAFAEFNGLNWGIVTSGEDWGTAEDLTSGGELIHLNTFNPGWSRGNHNTAQGTSIPSNVKKLGTVANASMGGTANFDDASMVVLGHVAGAASTPAETTSSEGDYSQSISQVSSTYGTYLTMAGTIEDDEVIEIPSLKMSQFGLSVPMNDAASWTASGIADQVIYSGNATPTNTQAEVDGLSLPAPSEMCFGGANHFIRVNSQSGGALSSSDDLELLSFSVNLVREGMAGKYVSRGANTQFVNEPLQGGLTFFDITLNFERQDQTKYDALLQYAADNELKLEAFIDGSAIAGGVNRSLRVQIPRCKIIDPSGGPQFNRGSNWEPTYTLRAFTAASAPTGMSGVTNAQFTLISTRSTKVVG